MSQGNNNGMQGTKKIEFIYRQDVPAGRDVTYATFVIDYRPLKTEPHQVHITVGGDKLTYASDAGSPAENLL